MRVTRYLWINNLPDRVTEQDIRDVLQSHGKIQSVRIHEHEGNNGAVVAFVDTKSATRAVESTVRLKKVNLSLQYCESSGIPGTNSSDQLATPLDYTQTSNTSLLQSDVNYSQHKSRSVSTVSDSSSVFHNSENNEQTDTCLSHTTNRNYPKDFKITNMNASPRFQNEHRGLKISHLPLRSSDTNLREGLFHEYKKHGKITSVFVRGQDEERICIITFKKSEDAEKALASSKGKVFFGTPISVQPHEGLNSEDPDLCPPEHALNEYHPKATKTLFVGNLCSGTITQDELRRTFRGYGEIIEIDIKIQANQPGTSYAFIQYGDIKSVVRALKEQETVRVNGKPVKLGFGKSQPTNVVWLDNLSPTINEAFLTRQFGRYGQLTHVVLDRKSMRALLYFDNVEVAQHAVNETRNRALVGRKVQIDYAGYECQVAFMKKLSKHDSFGQVYENYKYFGDNQRDHFASGNSKFSYRRSNCLRSSPVDHSVKYEQSSNKTRCGSSVSPHERSHQSSDRRRTFITSSPDDSKISGNWISSHSNRNSHHGKSDTKNVQSEDRSSVLSHRKHQHNQIPIKLKSSRYLSHTEGKSNLNSRTHVDQSNLRSRGQLLEETDDISSGSFSSDFTNDDSFFETSLKHSNTSSECSVPTSKLPSHVIRDHVLNIDKRKNVDTDFSQKCFRSNHYETESLDESSYSSNKKHTQKARESVSPQSRVASARLSVGRSRTSSSQHHSHWAIDRNSNLRQSSQECLEENVDQKHNKASFHSRARTLLKLPDADSSSPNHFSTKSKRIMLSKVASTYKDVEYSGRANTSTVSPISPDDAPFNESEGAYRRITNSACSDIPIGIKSHDTLTKLEMERAKLLRELSLLNNEVIGGSRGKTGSVTINMDSSNRKRAPSSLIVNDIPSPKLKRVENNSKCELVSIQSPALTSDNLMSSGFRESVPSSHSIRLIKASHDPKSELSGSKQGVVDKNVFALAVDNHLNTSDVASSSRRNHLSKTVQGHEFQNIHSNSRSETVFPAIATNGLNISGSRQPALITSSPRMVIAPESTSPMIHISPPSSPMIMGKSSYASTLGTSLSSSVLTASTSGSIISSLANSSSRDPRLAIHHTQLSNDVPPPPPETFKLPLWVDTSPHTEIMISNSLTSSVMRTQSPHFSKSLCDVETDVAIQDSSGCSLDERIRLLDVQLMKSEKARPTVDYSKFRIRRKAESNSTSQSTQINNPTQCTTGVSVTSCTPHSPVLTSTCSITTRCELGVIDMNNSSLPVSFTSSAGSTSPILSNSTLLNLVKPADTSEFVKSMLSFSKPSPSTPCDASNNMFSNEIATTNRHTISIPLCQNSFVTRLPHSCVSSSLSTASFIQSSASFCGKQKSPNNNRIHSNVCNVEHSSLSGAQPVGVATRMPSVKPFCGSDVLKPEDNLVGKGDNKFNTLKEGVDYVEKCEPVILSHSLNNASTEFNANLSSYVNDNQKCVDVSNKVGVHGVSPFLGSFNDFSAKTSQKTPTYQTISCQKSSPGDDFVNNNKCKPTSLLNIPLANAKKTQKHDSVKPIMDDFVFQNSLGGSVSKNNQLKKLHPDTPSSLLPTKRKPSTTSESKEISASNADKTVLGNISMTKSKTQKIPCQSIAKKLGSSSESSLKKHSIPNNKLQLTTDGNQSVFSANNRPLFCPEKKPVSPHSKKKKSVRDFKKKVIDSEDSDWEPNTITSSQHQSGELLDPDSSSESRYESMYDKIKRRTNQSTAKTTDSIVKPDVFRRFLKNKNREPKKPNSHKSLVDSDTDECLSDGSSIHSGDVSNPATKRTTKTNSLSNEIASKSVKQKVSTTSRAKLQATSVSPKGKKTVTDSEVSLLKEPSNKSRGRKAKKSNISNKAQSLTAQVRSNHKNNEQQGSVTALNYRPITRRKKTCIQKENVPAHGNDGKVVSGRINLTGRSKTQKQKAISAVNKQVLSIKNTRRSLVHRVFASTDSSSLSSVISESSDDDLSNNHVSDLSVKEEVGATEITQESNYQPIESKSPKLQLSRSCSPEDLQVDAAIRHTFGAFTAPFICFKTDTPHSSAIRHNAPQSTDVNIKFSPSSEDSKPTPPTLPMTDSSFSGDQQSNGISATKLQTRDHSDWSIFSSLAKQSTPIKDDNIHQNLSSTSGPAAESNDIPVNSTAETSYDTEDDLPSLEKHDNDEVSIPYESSILLHESDSLNNRAESLNGYNDDDLPPPVVSDIDHQLSYSDMPVVVRTVPDIIEEVIYDGLEVAIQDESHPAINKSMKSDSCKNSPKSLPGSPDVIESTVKKGLDQPLMDITDSFHIDLSSVTNNFSPNVLSSIALPIITSPSNSVSVQPTLFTPVSALHVTSQPSEVQTINQCMLVTISTVASTNLSPSDSALRADEEASVPEPCSSVPSSLNSEPQHHTAVILPTTTVSFPGSSFVTVSSIMPNSSTNVTPSSSVIKLESSPLSITCSSTTASSSQQLQNLTSHPLTTENTTPIAVAASLDNTAPTSHACLSSVSQSGNSNFDPSDYTSYVQRVIERVKQEKDEEILQQREKMKRPKRNTSVSTPSMTTSTTTNHTNTSATVTCSGVLSPTPINLPNIAPIPAADVLKPSSVVNIDNKNVTTPMCVANNSIVVQDSFSSIVKNVNSPNPQSANVSEPPITSSHSQQLVESASTEQNLYVPGCNNLTDDIHSRDPVDETIEAVVNGEFDEKEYVLKLSKGNFISNGHCHTLSGSIGSPSSHPDLFTLVPDDSGVKSDYHQSGISEAVCTRSNSSAVNVCVDTSSTLSVNKEFSDSIISMNHSSAVLTPMHVLTFVAASAATSTSQHISTSTAISPNVSTQSSSNLPTSTHHLPSASNPSSSSLDKISSMTPLAAYTPILNSSNSLPTDSTNTRIEEFAARFANNPFTTYFYSLLTQKQLSPSLSPSISSGDSVCQRPTDNMSLPICSSTKLKNLSIPNASVSGDTADYLAAATMAAMAAMTGPTQDMTSFGQTVASVSYSDSKPTSSDNPFLQVSATHLGIQEYPVIWRGRLSLKNEEVFVNMHYVTGNQDLLKSCMGVITEQQVALSNIATSSSSLGSCMTGDAIGPPHHPLRIVQRMRLEASQLEGVQRKLRQINDFCMCLTLASAPPLTPDASLNNEQIRMNRILCDGFIKYMLEKGAAGIINVCHPCTQQNLYVIHIFPPCEFSRCQLQACAPALYHSLAENSIPHVLTVITTV
ncbi:unnamed protein product [Schistosoma rodhaini]|uniref:Msx2-interacting protein n=1 Tax=Schistosoma rodhaini TaxID=6188 RepID=A0AA85EWS6_9TREM|nr:unnamed protein product [Schistosoma rodhaini]